MDWLVDAINFIFGKIGEAGTVVIGWLPSSPLQWTHNIDSQILRWINWLIPFGEMVVVAQGWLVCIGVWYVVAVVMRWIKAAGS